MAVALRAPLTKNLVRAAPVSPQVIELVRCAVHDAKVPWGADTWHQVQSAPRMLQKFVVNQPASTLAVSADDMLSTSPAVLSSPAGRAGLPVDRRRSPAGC